MKIIFIPCLFFHGLSSLQPVIINLILEGPCIIFLQYIYTFQRDTQCSSTDRLLMHRCQLYMFRTVTVHPQELLFRCCMCRLWYVVRNALSDTSRWCNVWELQEVRWRPTYPIISWRLYIYICNIPMHALGPAQKGMKAYGCLSRTLSGRKLSGLNSSGLG